MVLIRAQRRMLTKSDFLYLRYNTKYLEESIRFSYSRRISVQYFYNVYMLVGFLPISVFRLFQ